MKAVASARNASGFTALELLAAVTIVGILASLVVPSYHVYIARSRVLDAAMQPKSNASPFALAGGTTPQVPAGSA